MKKTICLDFDGVLNTYDGWKGEEELFQPREGLVDFLAALTNQYTVVIQSTRDPDRIQAWLDQHELSRFISAVTREKPMAHAYVDDRALRFNGNFDAVLDAARWCSKPHWEKY